MHHPNRRQERNARIHQLREQLKSHPLSYEAKMDLLRRYLDIVRRTFLHFQHVVATRNDLASLASIHNKFVRLALYQLPLSLREYLGETPLQISRAQAEALAPDGNQPPRLILPTRPTLLSKAETVLLQIIACGSGPVRNVRLHFRPHGKEQWATRPARLLGRRTYVTELGPFATELKLIEYYVSAELNSQTITAPNSAPEFTYWLTLA